jgi:hypothetical protein
MSPSAFVPDKAFKSTYSRKYFTSLYKRDFRSTEYFAHHLMRIRTQNSNLRKCCHPSCSAELGLAPLENAWGPSSDQPPDRGTSLIRNSPPSYGRHRALGIFLQKGPEGALFLMIEVTLYVGCGAGLRIGNVCRVSAYVQDTTSRNPYRGTSLTRNRHSP